SRQRWVSGSGGGLHTGSLHQVENMKLGARLPAVGVLHKPLLDCCDVLDAVAVLLGERPSQRGLSVVGDRVGHDSLPPPFRCPSKSSLACIISTFSGE